MSELYYMCGYGISISNLYDLLKDEYQDKLDNNGLDLFEKINNSTEISIFESDEENYLYIPCRLPYAPLFKSIQEIDEYFYNVLKPYLKTEITKENLAEQLDNVEDYCYY